MARALSRLILTSFVADAVCFLAYYLLPQPFLGLSQGLITDTLVLVLGVVGLLWLSVLVTALVVAGRRHEVGWMATFVILAVIGIAGAAVLYLVADLLTFFATILNILMLGNSYLAGALVVLFNFVVFSFPLPLAALRYARLLTA